MTRLAITLDGHTYSAELAAPPTAGEFYLWLDDQAVRVVIPDAGAPLEELDWLVIDGRPYEIALDPELRWIATSTGQHRLDVRNLDSVAVHIINGDGRVKAPIPGQVTRIFVSQGQAVESGERLCVLEAMKMENEIRAPHAGVISALPVKVGDVVSQRQLLVEIS